MTHTVEDSLVLFRVVCAQDFNMGDSCKLVCVVALLVIIIDNFFLRQYGVWGFQKRGKNHQLS